MSDRSEYFKKYAQSKRVKRMRAANSRRYRARLRGELPETEKPEVIEARMDRLALSDPAVAEGR